MILKRTLAVLTLSVFLNFPVAAQKQLLKIQAPEQPIDTAVEVLGFAQNINCFRFSMPLTMPEAEG